MANDDTAIGLGIPYFILIALTWITASSFSDSYPFVPWLWTAHGSFLIFIGCLLLIPVFVLTIIFLATGDNSVEGVAFGLGLPGFLLIISGTIIALYFTVSSFLIPTLLLVFTLPQLILAFGLFARRNFNLVDIRRTPQVQRRRRPLHTYPHQARGNRARGGSIRIPNEVKMASTYGQSVKTCRACGNTLDLRTRVCYFCGARQSDAPTRPSRSQVPPARGPRPQPRVQAQGPRPTFSFCPNCGARISTGHIFCTQCGASLE